MNIKDMVQDIFSQGGIYHCKSIDSMATVSFNVGGFGEVFTYPIVNVRYTTIPKELLYGNNDLIKKDNIRIYNDKEYAAVLLFEYSSKEDDQEDIMTVRRVITNAIIYGDNVPIYICDKNEKIGDEMIFPMASFWDGSDKGTKSEAGFLNIPKNYKGDYTYFLV